MFIQPVAVTVFRKWCASALPESVSATAKVSSSKVTMAVVSMEPSVSQEAGMMIPLMDVGVFLIPLFKAITGPDDIVFVSFYRTAASMGGWAFRYSSRLRPLR